MILETNGEEKEEGALILAMKSPMRQSSSIHLETVLLKMEAQEIEWMIPLTTNLSQYKHGKKIRVHYLFELILFFGDT